MNGACGASLTDLRSFGSVLYVNPSSSFFCGYHAFVPMLRVIGEALSHRCANVHVFSERDG